MPVGSFRCVDAVTLQAKAQHLAGVGVVIHYEYERRRASRAEHKEMGLS